VKAGTTAGSITNGTLAAVIEIFNFFPAKDIGCMRLTN
jgi:hypothetical protein